MITLQQYICHEVEYTINSHRITLFQTDYNVFALFFESKVDPPGQATHFFFKHEMYPYQY